MRATPSLSTLRNETRDRVRRAAVLLATAALATGPQVLAQQQTAAVLKLSEVDFFYRSSAALFSCSEMQSRVASILRALGASDDVQVNVTGCDTVVVPGEAPVGTWQTPSDQWRTSSERWRTSSDGLGNRDAGHEQSVHVRVRVMMPVEATPEVLAQLEKDKARRELVSRVTGNPAANLYDPVVFRAERRSVTLSRSTIDLRPKDCELLEQMSTSIFRELKLRVVRRGPYCDRREISHMSPQLTVEALMPVMPSTPQLAPPAQESDPDPSAPAASETSPSDPANTPKPQ
ncbi:MAG TPA: hypothetical protein VHK24_00130 [Steroidobacter sp.]|nr:hypothetical protein [Steroidobacter sp.]